MQKADEEGRTALHTACDSGEKEKVLNLLSEMKDCGILEEELMRCDKSGRRPLGLALAERKRKWKWDRKNEEWKWEHAESDGTYESRQDMGEEMLEWIKERIAPDKTFEIRKR